MSIYRRYPENRQHTAGSAPSRIGSVSGLLKVSIWDAIPGSKDWDTAICFWGNSSTERQSWSLYCYSSFQVHSCTRNFRKDSSERTKPYPGDIYSWIRNLLGTDKVADWHNPKIGRKREISPRLLDCWLLDPFWWQTDDQIWSNPCRSRHESP